MANMTDKMPLKDFNAIFKNDELAKEISQLIEKANSTKKSKSEIRYSRDELIEIRKSPLSNISKTAFYTRLEKSNLSDNIINSLVRKGSLERNQNVSKEDDSSNNNDFYDENAQSYSRYKNNARNSKTRESIESFRENLTNSRYDREKNYRANHSESVQCWRTEKTLNPSNRNTAITSTTTNNNNKREYQDSRYTQRSAYERYNQRKGYGNRNGYRDDYEEEPEWFSNGPESMNEFIDLKGFDDDEKCVTDDDRPESSSHKRSSVELNGRNSGKLDSSKNESFNKNTSAMSDINSMLSMDISNLFNSPNASFLENKDINDFPLFSFGDLNASNSSSRAEKWFKNKKESASAENSVQNISKTTSPLTVDSDIKSGSIMDLFQNVNLRKLSQPANNLAFKVDLSKATSLADLEASMLNSASTKKVEGSIAHKNGPSHESAAVMSKLLSLAGQHEPNANASNDVPVNLPQMTNHFPMGEPFGRPLNDQQQQTSAPMNPPMFPNFNQLSGQPADRMLHPSFFKGNAAPPMPPFPFGEGNLPFPIDNMHPRPPSFFGQPIPPEMAHQFVGPNAFVPSGFMPPGPFTPPMMGPLGQMPPAIAAQVFAHMAMMQQQQQQQQQQQHSQPQQHPSLNMIQDAAKSKNDESNLADKLLKNSKFTPTSVFRKLKDHDQSKVKSSSTKVDPLMLKSDLEMLSAAVRSGENHFEMHKEPRGHMSVAGDISPMRAPNTIPHPLSNYQTQPPNDKNTSDMTQLLQQLNLNRTPNPPPSLESLKPNPISLNPNDIFNAMKKGGEHGAAPLPMMNALKLEDLEKF